MSDEHRADVTGYSGNSVVRTPVLDKLAETGVVFSNAYTPCPICVPGRQCMMAGQLPNTCKCYDWAQDLPEEKWTLANQFTRYAYETVAAGKLHVMNNNQMQGFTRRLAPPICHVEKKYRRNVIWEEFDKYPSIDGVHKWMNQEEVEKAQIGIGKKAFTDRIATEVACYFAKEYFGDGWYDKPVSFPLLLKLSLQQPHYPYIIDEERFHYYLNRVPIYTDKPCDHPILSKSQNGLPVEVSERDIRRTTAAYYGMVELVDKHFGELIDSLELVGQNLDDWIIVYTSDHGEMLGQHGIWEKTRFYDGSARVPLIIRWPKGFKGGRVVDENVNLCDLFATLCELAGLEIPEGLDSRSLVPLLKGDSSNWNNESISQISNYCMIKRDDLKYQWYASDIPEVLFDLAKDPGETRNVIDEPEYAGDVAAFRKRIAELGYGSDADTNYVNAGYS
jgi:choline-sulfatase